MRQEVEEASKLTMTCKNSLSQYRDDSYLAIEITVKLSAIEDWDNLFKKYQSW